MKLFIVLLISIAINLTAADIKVVNQENTQLSKQLPSSGVAVDEVVVESSLYIKPKQERPHLRRVRRYISDNFNFLKSFVEHRRVKRQRDGYDEWRASANAAAHQNYNKFLGFGSSAENEQAQAFNVVYQNSIFGGPAEGSLTPALNGNSYGLRSSASSSHELTFKSPNGKSTKVASTNSLANGIDVYNANKHGSAVSINRI